jgi:hypothetical protein
LGSLVRKGLPLLVTSKADIGATQTDVCFVPIADIQPSFDHLVTEREQRRGHARDARSTQQVSI